MAFSRHCESAIFLLLYSQVVMILELRSLSESTKSGNSYERGRGRYAKRDSMGRYSSDMLDDDYSERRIGRGYSRDEGKDIMMNRLGELMEDADPKEREALKKCMRAIEEA